MSYFYGILTTFAVIHTITYGNWLNQHGNKRGSYGVYALAATVIGLYIFVLFRKQVMALVG